MKTIIISQATARRYVLGRQGLWPGRRWAGKDGADEALRTIGAVQMDPLNVVARSQDIVLWSRVIDYDPAHLQALLYHDRLFFDYGGWLAIYPMSELPSWRVPMRRRESEPRWATFAASHQGLLDEVRAELRARGPLGNRDFTGRTRVQSYRGRKDSALARGLIRFAAFVRAQTIGLAAIGPSHLGEQVSSIVKSSIAIS